MKGFCEPTATGFRRSSWGPLAAASLTALVALASLLTVGAPLGGTAWAAEGRPAYQVLRQNEDWSFLKDGATDGGDLFDPIKYVGIDDEGWAWVSFGGQIRERLESWQNFDFSTGPTPKSDDLYLQTRLRYHADLHLGSWVRAFVEGKSAFSTDRDLPGGWRTADVDELALQNGFLDLIVPAGEGSLTLRGGRQEMLFGAQRLVSPLDWSNTRRTFDGASAIYRRGNFTATGFFTRPVTIKKYDSNPTDNDVDFYGIYTTRLLPDYGGGYDLYWLALDRKVDIKAQIDLSSDLQLDSEPMSTIDEERHTVGLRFWGAGEVADYEVEGAYQFGDYGSESISAYMLTVQGGFTFTNCECKPRLEIGVDFASGDDSPYAGDVRTFNQLFPLGHAHLGYIDEIGRQNITDLRTGITFPHLLGNIVKLDWHYFMRAQQEDALYNAAGAVVRPGYAGSPRDVAGELDLTIQRSITRHGDVIVGYSRMFADDFIEVTGSNGDISLAYLILQYTI